MKKIQSGKRQIGIHRIGKELEGKMKNCLVTVWHLYVCASLTAVDYVFLPIVSMYVSVSERERVCACFECLCDSFVFA